MPRRVRKKTPLFAPAGSLIRKLSETDKRLRRKILKISLWGLAVLFFSSIAFGTYSIPRIIRLSFQKSSLIETNRMLTADLIDAARVRDLLTSDASYIEYIARTRYYMVHPNEIIYRYRGR
ncbi:MAG: hypothetical protein DRP45_02720 [Candidatus Zixiibacteriota bacterium]|nr:MAG: hypothetical protein DRP45_02720 [candidate division Zixibacteria bacterium]